MVANRLFQPLGQDVDRLFGSAADWVGDGRTLSDRLWEARRQDRAEIDKILRHGLMTGADPLDVARDLEDYLLPAGRPVRDPTTDRVVKWKRGDAGQLLRDASGRLIPANAKGVLTRTPRSGLGSAAARTLARTETTRAFGQATIQAASLNPFVDGIQWALSASSHKNQDQCDDNAAGHSDGMPAGVYRIDEVPQHPSHPNCRCVLIPYSSRTTDDIVSQLRRDAGIDTSNVVPFAPPQRRSSLWDRTVALFRAAKALVIGEAA